MHGIRGALEQAGRIHRGEVADFPMRAGLLEAKLAAPLAGTALCLSLPSRLDFDARAEALRDHADCCRQLLAGLHAGHYGLGLSGRDPDEVLVAAPGHDPEKVMQLLRERAAWASELLQLERQAEDARRARAGRLRLRRVLVRAVESLAPEADAARVLRSERLALRERNRAAAKIRGRTISEATDTIRQTVAAEASAYRSRHPYSRAQHSTRKMAAAIAGKIGSSPGTVRGHLAALGIR